MAPSSAIKLARDFEEASCHFNEVVNRGPKKKEDAARKAYLTAGAKLLCELIGRVPTTEEMGRLMDG